jgi:metal-sulfur cluster biosynthetic enzyme
MLADVRRAADTVTDPCSVTLGRPVGLAAMGVVRSIELPEPGRVQILVALTDPMCPFWMRMERDLTEAVEALDGITSCEVRLSSEIWSPDMDHRYRAWTSLPVPERQARARRRPTRE